jgi:hypothetical protein
MKPFSLKRITNLVLEVLHLVQRPSPVAAALTALATEQHIVLRKPSPTSEKS